MTASAAAFLEAVALRGGHLGGTTSRLLQLLERYGHDALDSALREALARGVASAASVAHVLEQKRRAEGTPPDGARNVVLVAPQGLGKTMIAQNIALKRSSRASPSSSSRPPNSCSILRRRTPRALSTVD